MIIKVCGIREKDNLASISELSIDMIGINFYPSSSRYVGTSQLEKREGIKNVGVFVNASIDKIKKATKDYQLDYAQLHGDEDVTFCKSIQTLLPIIKVFRIDEQFDWQAIQQFDFADYFLFDTKTALFGGSGKKFDWSVLNNYKLKIPFLLSGGISSKDAHAVLQLRHEQFKGIDINSKFEISPALKDVGLVREFTKEIRQKI